MAHSAGIFQFDDPPSGIKTEGSNPNFPFYIPLCSRGKMFFLLSLLQKIYQMSLKLLKDPWFTFSFHLI